MGIKEFILLMFSYKKVLLKVAVVYFMLVERRVEVMGRRGRRLKLLPDELKEGRGCRKLKEALDRTVENSLWKVMTLPLGRDSSVGKANRYGLDGPGVESRWGARFSAPVQTGPGAHPAPYTMGTGSLPGVKRPGRGVDHPSHLAPKLRKEQSYNSFPPLVLRDLF